MNSVQHFLLPFINRPNNQNDLISFIFQSKFTAPDILKLLMFKNLRIGLFKSTFCNAYSEPQIPMVYLVSKARCIISNQLEESLVLSLTFGELFQPITPDGFYMSEDESKECLRNAVWTILNTGRAYGYLRYDQETWIAAQQKGGELESIAHILPSELPLYKFSVDSRVRAPKGFTQATAYILLKFFATYFFPASLRNLGFFLISHMHIAVRSQCILPYRLQDDIMRGLKKVFNRELVINIDLIRRVLITYNTNGAKIDESTAKRVFTYYASQIPEDHVRFVIILESSLTSGLSAYLVTVKAMATFSDFDWKWVSSVYPKEISRFKKALKTIGSNLFYGYKKDMSKILPNYYKTMAYISKELLVHIYPEETIELCNVKFWTPILYYKAEVDRKIDEYIQMTSQRKGSYKLVKDLTSMVKQSSDLIGSLLARKREA